MICNDVIGLAVPSMAGLGCLGAAWRPVEFLAREIGRPPGVPGSRRLPEALA